MPSEMPALDVDTVAVGILRLDELATPLDDLAALLSADEQARAEAFHFAVDRDRFVAVRGSLRIVLGTALDIEPAELTFTTGPYGKPTLANDPTDLDFNVSHSADRALIGLSRTHRIGVDIEQVRGDLDIDGLAARVFSSTEQVEVSGRTDDARTLAFLGIWTRKEACVKGTGLGLSIAPETFTVDLHDRNPADLGDHGTWATVGVAVEPGYVASVAVDTDGGRLTTFDGVAVVSGRRPRKPKLY